MSADDYAGMAHVNQPCVYCDSAKNTDPNAWEWYAADASPGRARFTWAGVVRDVAREYGANVHPVTPSGVFYSGGPSDYAQTCDYVALPLCYEEALRHVQYEAIPLRRLFKALANLDMRAAAGAAWALGGRWALRDYLRTAGAVE